MPEEMDKGHPDAAQDQGQIDSNLAQLVQELAPILEHLMQKIDYLEDRLENQLIGGLQQEYAKKAKMDMIGGLKSRHGAKFQDLLAQLAQATGEDEDGFWDELHGMMGDRGIDEAGEGDFMDQIHSHLSGKRDEMLKALQGAISTAEPVGEPEAIVKMEASGEPEAVAKGAEKAVEEVKKATSEAPKKEEAPAVGSKEYFQTARRGRKAPPKARK